ncbi:MULTISPECIES: amidohydrolase [unclassified Leucobacter]|uniref:amidohydrolase n=1 Tax=unclassified Leucobacter TaxID=2621730 RepID=UPI00165DA485|nr:MULTISPECIES: amidohydrolase [unclassified Leucobacter]MBC9936524.1 amidohydrolase [Leucobacter sp. cx-87]
MPDVVLFGSIWTGDPDRPVAEGIAIKDGRILAIGDEQELQRWVSAATAVEHVRGKILPAFQDAHTHLIEGAMFDVRCNLHDLNHAELLQSVKQYAAQLPAGAWVRGGGWTMDDFARQGVNRDVLDQLVGDRPAYLTARDGHSAWVSSKALAIANITDETEDPAGGRIERDIAGRPTGILHETALRLIQAVLPETTPEEWTRAFEIGQEYMHSLGITAWQDARIESDLLEAYLDADRTGRLRSRVALSLAWDRNRGLDQIEDLVRMRDRLPQPRLSAPTIKLFVDGVLENRTASMLEEYSDVASHGSPLYRDSEIHAITQSCEAAGFSMHFHAVGDSAVRSALDACESSAQTPSQSATRHQICHLQSVDPSDAKRFGELGVIANIQPLWACNDAQMVELCLPGIGETRYATQYPFRSIQDSGGLLAGGSDWRVSTPNPFPQIEVALTRRAPGDSDAVPLAPAESLDLSSDESLYFGRCVRKRLGGCQRIAQVGSER